MALTFELSGIIRTLLPFPVTVTVAGDLKDILPVFMSMSSCTRHPDSYKSDNKARSLMPLGVLGLGLSLIHISHDSYQINITSIDAEHDKSMREVYGLDKTLRE